jgi:hypothetical protein
MIFVRLSASGFRRRCAPDRTSVPRPASRDCCARGRTTVSRRRRRRTRWTCHPKGAPGVPPSSMTLSLRYEERGVTKGSGSEPGEARRPFVSGSLSSVSICTFVPVKQVHRVHNKYLRLRCPLSHKWRVTLFLLFLNFFNRCLYAGLSLR